MDNLDSHIKDYLTDKASLPGDRGAYPTSEDLYRFVMDELQGEALEKMAAHLRDHADDQAVVVKARELLKNERGAQGEPVPAEWIERAKSLMAPALKCPHCGKAITPFKSPERTQKFRNAVLFLAAAAAFILSFAYRRYFFQFVALAVLLGVKWIVDQKSMKTQILIYRALREDEGKTHPHKDLHRISSHL